MNNIYINGRFLTQPLSGMQRFAGELLSALDRKISADTSCLSNFKLILLVPSAPNINYNWKNIEVTQVGFLSGHLWEQINLAWFARDGILLNLTASGPLFHNNSVLVLHDAAVFVHPEHFSRNYLIWHRFIRPKITKKAKKLITISSFSRKELSAYCDVPESDFTIISDSAEHITHPISSNEILKKYGLRKGRYALTVGNQSPNKNIAFAIKAFEQANPKDWILAVAGSASDKIFGSSDSTQNRCVKRLGRVSDAELKALYENAGLFLFPSKYEGFGVPPLEAMKLGCPVLSANVTAMPEILGNAAVYFQIDDINDLISKIIKITEDEQLRNDLITKGYQRSSIYSWEQGANTLLNLLTNLSINSLK